MVHCQCRAGVLVEVQHDLVYRAALHLVICHTEAELDLQPVEFDVLPEGIGTEGSDVHLGGVSVVGMHTVG
jgi:hypothetical protein